jgi:hypothetical protein
MEVPAFPAKTYATKAQCWCILYPDDPRSYKEALEQDPTSDQVLTCQRETDESYRIYRENRERYQVEYPEAYAAHMNRFRGMVSYYEDETDMDDESSDDDESLDEDELLAIAEFEEATRRYEDEKQQFFDQYPHLRDRLNL